jgi:DNA processing protein
VGADLPPEAYAAALAGLGAMHVRRLGTLLRHHPPQEAYAVAAGGHPPSEAVAHLLADPVTANVWRREATLDRVAGVWAACARLGVEVLVIGGERYPACLVDDRLPPPVLFVRCDLGLLDGRRVGIVGTRNATSPGRDIATRLGEALADAGVHVVSGLARGIDGCAHRGVLRSSAGGRPIAVVASGVDIVYPREHRDLWEQVAEHGLLVSEAPPGTAPEAYRFPLRNRLIAAFSELLVVVESRSRGGSLITVTEAAERGVPVMAVPGGPASVASCGTNNLLREGAGVVVDADDVLVALGLDHSRSGGAVGEQRPRPGRADIAVYLACAAAPGTVDVVAAAGRWSLIDAAMALARLEQAGWIVQSDGWFEPTGAPLR